MMRAPSYYQHAGLATAIVLVGTIWGGTPFGPVRIENYQASDDS
jgi:hypothetical protein